MKKSIKSVLILSIVSVLVFSLCACDNGTSVAEKAQQDKTNKALEQMNKELGMPNITFFTEKKLLKQVYELRDKSGLICYAYTVNEMDGKLVYQGKCMGYGLPYSTEYTNPQKVTAGSVGDGSGSGNVTIPQADPNGLYAPSSADATWLVMVNDDGTQSVTYCESNVIVSQTKKPVRLCESWSIPSDY